MSDILILYQLAYLIDPDLHEVVVAVLLQVPPQVSRAALEDLSDVVHLDVEDLDVDLVERDGPQDLLSARPISYVQCSVSEVHISI